LTHGVVGIEESHLLVGLDLAPEIDVVGIEIIHAGEYVVGPGERLVGSSAPPEYVVVPGDVGADAGHAGRFALVRDGDNDVGGGSSRHEVHFVVVDHVGGHLGGAVRV
jgi:hypothetical protein